MSIVAIYRVDMTVPDDVTDFIMTTRLEQQWDVDFLAACKDMATSGSNNYASTELWAEGTDIDVAIECHTNLRTLITKYTNLMKNRPRCSCCGTLDNLHEDLGSGGPWRCDSPDCMVF